MNGKWKYNESENLKKGMKCTGAKNKRGRQNGGHSHFIDPTHGISQAPAVFTQQPVTRA